MTTVLQIVPRLPPALCGLGDFALRLADAWREFGTCHCEFLEAGIQPNAPAAVNGFRRHQLSRKRADTLAEFLSTVANRQCIVLLHYVGYGYSPRGAPLWLVKGLKQWRASRTDGKLAIFFHELFASGPPWTSAFWLSPLQRKICGDLAGLANLRITNRSASAAWIDRRARGASQLLPVFSNLGEPHNTPPLSARSRQMVVFGGLSRKPRDLRKARSFITSIATAFKVEKLVTFGPIGVVEANLGIPVQNLGVITRDEASSLLLQSQIGYVDYNPMFLGKSTIFAAFAAHGVLPLLLHGSPQPVDGLVDGQHYHSSCEVGTTMTLEIAQQIAAEARAWYQPHSIAQVARAIAATWELIV